MGGVLKQLVDHGSTLNPHITRGLCILTHCFSYFDYYYCCGCYDFMNFVVRITLFAIISCTTFITLIISIIL